MYTTVQLNDLNTSLPRSRDVTIIYFIAGVSFYLSILGVHYFEKSEAIKLAANAIAFSIFVALLPKLFAHQGRIVLNKYYALALGMMTLGMLGNGAFNYDQMEMSDFLKMAIAPLFFIIGYRSLNIKEFRGRARRQLVFLTLVVVAIPVFIGVGEIAGWGDRFREEESVSIFSNRNNAALYAIVLSILFVILNMRLRWMMCYLVFIAALFGTLGVLMAVILSIAFVYAKKGKLWQLALLSGALILSLLLMPGIPVFERLSGLNAGLSYLLSSGEIWHISEMNYGDLSQIMGGSSDVSFFFRIKHWSELMISYLSSSMPEMLFGHGVGSSVRDTSMHLVPHNDYLRYLYECGVLPFIGFALLNIRIVKDLASSYVAVPFMTVSLYFFSENLINNFLSMMLFYFFAGFLIAKKNAIIKLREKYEYSAG